MVALWGFAEPTFWLALGISARGRTGRILQPQCSVWTDSAHCQVRMACACMGGGQWPGHTLVMEQLITAGADVDAKTNEG